MSRKGIRLMSNKRTEELLKFDREHIVHSKWAMGGKSISYIANGLWEGIVA